MLGEEFELALGKPDCKDSWISNDLKFHEKII